MQPILCSFFLMLTTLSISNCNQHTRASATQQADTTTQQTIDKEATNAAVKDKVSTRDNVDTYMEYVRSACYGSCPAFTFTVSTDGQVIYKGRRHAPRTGIFTSAISAKQMNTIKTWFEEANFDQWAARYPENEWISDLSNTKISFRLADDTLKSTTINHQPPAEFDALQSHIEAFIESLTYVPLDQAQD